MVRFVLVSTTLLSLLFLSHRLQAQTGAAGSVTGTVVDDSLGRPMEFVNVVVHDAESDAVVTGGVTDRHGEYSIGGLQPGKYRLRFSLISFAKKRSAPFVIDARRSRVAMGTTRLSPAAVKLQEVVVTGDKALFNNSIDRKVYNVSEDIMSKAGSASDLLQNVPSVEVDVEGNVSLRGSDNVTIMINGKPSPLMDKSAATVLQQMPAGSIASIEVITNPSAKYKPDGTAGIINIVLKKGSGTGFNGSVSANAGNRDRVNANIRLSYDPGLYSVFGSYAVRRDSRNRINTVSRESVDSANVRSFYHEDLTSLAAPVSHMASLGGELRPDAFNTFGVSGDFFYDSFTREDRSFQVSRDASGSVTEDLLRSRRDPEYEKEIGLTMFAEHAFPREGHKLRLDFSMSDAPEVEDNHYTNEYAVPLNPATFDNTAIRQEEKQTRFSLEYANPVDDGMLLEAGYTGEINASDMDFRAEYFDDASRAFVIDKSRTNRFLYDETIHALYGTWRQSFGGFGFQAGLRAEQVYGTSNLVTLDSVMRKNYFSVFPTLHLSYKFNPTAELQLNYSRRTRRPDGDDLNPFPEYRDPRNIQAGNPRLLPEYIHSLELGCQVQNDFLSVLPSIYYRYTTNRFTMVTQALNDSVLLTTETNLANDQAAGLELVVSANTGSWFTAHVNGNVFYNRIDASNLGFGENKSTISWSSALMVRVNFAKSSALQFNANFHSRRLTPQGEVSPSYTVNMGFRQELLENTLGLVLTVSDVFQTMKREMILDTPALRQTSVNTRDSRVIYLGATYTFGKSDKKNGEDQIKYEEM